MTGASGSQDQPHEPDEPIGAGLTYSQNPSGVWDVERAEHDRKVAAEQHRRGLVVERQVHELEQARKDNDQRRKQQMALFVVGIGVTVLMLGVALGSIFFVEDEGTKEWARSIATLIVGGMVGGVIGYVTGKPGK